MKRPSRRCCCGHVIDPGLQQGERLRDRVVGGSGGEARGADWVAMAACHARARRSVGRLRGDDDREAMRDVDDAGDEIERHVLVGLDDERGRDAAGGELVERGAEAVERDDLVVEIEDGLALERRALVVVVLRSERDGDDEPAGRRADGEGAARGIDLDARLEHEGRAEQEKAEQQQDDVDDRREIDQAAQGLERGG